MTHDLKTWPEYFIAVMERRKRFEFRCNDRNYKVGDKLRLKEYDPNAGYFTGNELLVTVLYVFSVSVLLTDNSDWVILSISEPLGLSGVQN